MGVWGHPERSLPHTAAATPESLWSCLGRRGIGTPRGGWGHTQRSRPHTAAVTPDSLGSCLGRGGLGTPRGVLGAHREVLPPHSGGYTRVPPALPGLRRDRDAPWGFRGHTERSFPHTAAVTPESLRPCLGHRGIGTPRGGFGAHGEVLPPHGGGYTRVPPVLSGPRRDRDAPEGFGAHGEVLPPHGGGYTRVPPTLPGPRRDRDALWRLGGTRRGPSPTQRRLHPTPSGPA